MIVLNRRKALAFDDVLLLPQYSEIKSRKDVSTSVNFLGRKLEVPVVSSNMTCVTGANMAQAMHKSGGLGCLPRFVPIANSVQMFLASKHNPMVSIGLGHSELERAIELAHLGANIFVVDVAHGAHSEVVAQTKMLRRTLGPVWIVAGNFATGESMKRFLHEGGIMDAAKIGIGGGSACTTRLVTGCGLPTFQSIVDCAGLGIPIIADGGIRNSGDMAKALAAGADVVMLGKLLVGTDESAAEFAPPTLHGDMIQRKRYRGSASYESYEAQGKQAEWRTAEGESFYVDCTGPVASTLQKLTAGLRSAMSYVGASDLEELKANAEFTLVSSASTEESEAHGKY